MPYWLKYTIAVIVLLLMIRLVLGVYEKIKQKGVDEHENRKALRRFISRDEKIKRAKHYELLIIAREFFLIPGVIRKRSSPGTDEDDR